MNDDQPIKKQSLSEISHLFLSDLRDNVTGGVRPKRLPPGAPRPEVSIDLTPEEYAQSFGGSGKLAEAADELTQPRFGDESEDVDPPAKPITAVIAAHLNGSQPIRVRQYAKHLAASGKRIGLIEIDAEEIRISCFDRATPETDLADPMDSCDPRHVTQSLAELAWDVDRWLLVVSDLRPGEARKLLRKVDRWTLLSTCDHDGVVSCYRSIKGLADGHRPKLSLALLNATDEQEAGRVHRKVASVCQQFLNWPMVAEPAVEPVDSVGEHAALRCRPPRGTGRDAAPHWQAVADFLSRSTSDVPDEAVAEAATTAVIEPERGEVKPLESKRLADVVFPTQPEPTIAAKPAQPTPAPASTLTPTPAFAAPFAVDTSDSEVTDLGTGETTEANIVSAVLRKAALGLVETPLHPPSAPHAVLAVNRERRLVVLAVANQGLSELRSLGQAYRWVVENRPLLSMALPQFAIDTHAMPCMKLLVDRRDASSDVLQPLMASENVSVQTYRKLRWGDRTGLLLEAA